MSPRNDDQEPEAMPNQSVNIPHDVNMPTPAPISAPPLPKIEPLPVRPINITDNIPTSPPVAPVAPLTTIHEFHEEHDGRRWPVVLMYIVLAFLVAVLVVLAGRWVYKQISGNDAKPVKPTPAGQNQTPPATPPVSPTQPGGSVGGAGANQTPASNQSSQLPNNGPGDVVAIFVGTAIVVGGLHYLYGLRQSSKS